MLVLTVSQLLEASEGSVPESFRGKIKKVWPQTKYTKKNPRNGESPQGTMQKLIITDGAAEIEVMFDGRGEVSRTMEGSQLHAIASNGQRGPSGMKRKSNTYNNKTTPQVWVYDSAEVIFEGQGAAAGTNGNHAQNGNAPAPRSPAPAPQTNGHANGSAPARQQSAGAQPATNGTGATPAARAATIKEFNLRLGRASSAYERCFDAAAGMARRLDERLKDIGGFKPTADTIEKMAACLMVQACWTQKPSDMDAFPTRAFSSYDEAGNLIGAKPPTNAAPPNGGGETAGAQRQGAPFNA